MVVGQTVAEISRLPPGPDMLSCWILKQWVSAPEGAETPRVPPFGLAHTFKSGEMIRVGLLIDRLTGRTAPRPRDHRAR